MNWLSVVQIIAAGIAVEVFIHTICHLTGDIPKLVYAPHDVFEEHFGHDFDHQPSYAEVVRMPVLLTGIFMTTLMIVAMLLATPWFRRSLVKLPWPLHRLHGFNVFWYSHHLFIIVYCLLLVHSILLLLKNPWYERSVRRVCCSPPPSRP
jgi:respiratory burst oxidase